MILKRDLRLSITVRWTLAIFSSVCIATSTGCNFRTGGGNGTGNESGAWKKLMPGMREDGRPGNHLETDVRVANPPARTIRFDGHEMVIGNGEAVSISPDDLLANVKILVDAGRRRSAALVAMQHADSAERLLRERWADGASNPSLTAIAKAHAYRSQCAPQDGWPELIKLAATSKNVCQEFLKTRNDFARRLQSEDPTQEHVTQLQSAATAVGHPLVEIDSLRLQGLRYLLAKQPAEALKNYRTAIEIATKFSMVDQVSDLGLMASESARRADLHNDSASAWTQAVGAQMTLLSRDGVPVDPNFWNRAESLRPVDADWPVELGMVLGHHIQQVGCRVADGKNQTDASRIKTVLWTAVGWAQYERGQPQLALVTLKKAEQSAVGNDTMYLRIAQGKCLGLLGQTAAATATLSGPLACKDNDVVTSATAALGSMKIQVGAYEQGASLLNKALSNGNLNPWPGRAHSQADLALAKLILGETAPGLDALHLAQATFIQNGDWLALVKSLENEMSLLQHEERTEERNALQQRIADIERI